MGDTPGQNSGDLEFIVKIEGCSKNSVKFENEKTLNEGFHGERVRSGMLLLIQCNPKVGFVQAGGINFDW
jgi:hypothetical protein